MPSPDGFPNRFQENPSFEANKKTLFQVLLTLAPSGNPPPAWVQEILTPTGKEHYQELLLQSATIPTQDAIAVANDLYPALLFTAEVSTHATGG